MPTHMADHQRGVLFDVDGTLVDTNFIHAVCWWEAFRQHEHVVPMANLHRAIGMGSDKLIGHVLGAEHDPDEDAALSDAHATLYRPYWERLVPLPGAADLLRACAKQRLRVTLASSAKEPELAALRRALDADDVIHSATSSSDAESSKPDPDIVAVALEKAELAAADVVFVGDSVWDVQAAGRLDIPCVGLTCGGTSAAELTEAGAVEVHESPEALLRALATSTVTRR
jgi:HAD superfamily hydrolase (TIGR01509 family)